MSRATIRRRSRPRLAGYGLPILSFIVGIILWELIVRFFKVPAFLFPPPSAIAQIYFTGRIDWVGQTLVTPTWPWPSFLSSSRSDSPSPITAHLLAA